MLNKLIYMCTLNTVAASDSCEKAIMDLVSPGGLIDLIKSIVVRGSARSIAEFLKPFFEKLFDLAAKVVHPVFAVMLDILGSDSFSQKLLEFVQKARAAAQCLDQYDETWREAAERAGVDVDTLKHAIRQLSGKSEEEIRRRVEELTKSLEEVERQIRTKYISPDATYFYARDWLGGVEEEGKLKICDVLLHACERGAYVEYVSNQLDKTVVDEVEKKAVGGGGLVVVKGAKGIGKSTAVRVALYRVLQLLLEVGGQYYKPVVVAVEKYSEFNANNFIRVAKRYGFYPIFYFDPSMFGDYPKEPSVLYQPEMPIGELRSILGKLRNVTGAVAVVVLSNDQYQLVKELIKDIQPIDADQLLAPREEERRKYVHALVKSYSNCHDEVIKKVADAVASQFADGYAVAAVLAADWLGRNKCSSGEVEGAVERAERDVHRFALDYIWHVVLGKDGNVAKWATPLILAVGLYGPHPPKLGEAIAAAMSPVVEEIFGKGSVRRDDNVLNWLSQPLHGILYEAIEKVARGAVYRRFGVGSDELCQGSREEPCLLVEIVSKVLKKVSQKRYSVVEVAEEYAKLIAKALITPGPAGVRQIDFLIDDFLQVYDHVAEDGRWRIRYEVKGSGEVKVVEEVIDELDVLSALYGQAMLPVWDPQLKPLEEWFFVGGWKVKVVGLYLHPLLRERGGELIKKAVAIVREAEKRGFYTGLDILRAVSIAAVGLWNSASDEELENAMRLAAYALDKFATFSATVLVYFWPLLSETWRRVVSRQDGGLRQRLADWLIIASKNAARGHPLGLLLSLVSGIDKPGQTVTQRFDALYNAASYAGRLEILYALLSTLDLDIGGVNVVVLLLGKHGPKEVFEEVVKRVEELVSQLYGVEKTYAMAQLYPLAALQYTFFTEFDKALKFTKEALKALDELRKAYEEGKALTEEKLRPYLELRQVKPDLETELKVLSWHVYHHAARVYMDADELTEAVERAVTACDFARELNSVYYEVLSCSLPLRLSVIRGDAPPVEDFEKSWQSVLHDIARLGAEAIATTLGEYVVALASADRLSEVEKVLKEWNWALKLHPDTSALTYGVLSLFDGRYLEKVVEHLPEGARANLPKFADVLRDADEAGLFTKIPEIVASAMNTLAVSYGLDVVIAFSRIVSDSANLFLSALVGLAYCKRGEEWGLKLARESARVGSGIKGIASRLFAELYKALENATMDNCVTEKVLSAVYKLYYLHV